MVALRLEVISPGSPTRTTGPLILANCASSVTMSIKRALDRFTVLSSAEIRSPRKQLVPSPSLLWRTMYVSEIESKQCNP